MYKKLIIKKNSFVKLSKQAGFTLIELMVTLSIFVIITGVVLFSQNQFNGSILLTNLAYDLTLTVRQAQTFGLSGKYDSAFGNNKPTYGAHFEVGNNSKYMILFADTDINAPGGKKLTIASGSIGDSTFCSTSNPECLEKYTIKRNNKIYQIFGPDSSGALNQSKNSVDITFVRPEPTAYIYFDGDTTFAANKVRIVVSTDDGSATRSVIIEKIGQIYVER